MELTQVRYFLALSRALNFTRAAEACNVTQPALTRAIQRLEEEFGGALLFRERSLTQLTDLGRSMLPHLEAMLNAADSAAELADARRRQPVASLKIGLGPGIGATAVALAIREVLALLPDVKIRFEEAGAAVLVDGMLSDMLDCALVPADYALPERLNYWPLYTEDAVVVLPPSHPLAECTAVTADDLLGETLLQGERCGGFAHRLSVVSGRQFRTICCDGATSHLLALVQAGLGITVLSERVGIPAPLTVRPVTEPAVSRQIRLAAVAGRPHGAAVSGFIKLCRARSTG